MNILIPPVSNRLAPPQPLRERNYQTISKDERKARDQRRKEKGEAHKKELARIKDELKNECLKMDAEHGMDAGWFEKAVLGGLKLERSKHRTNPYNAFLHYKAQITERDPADSNQEFFKKLAQSKEYEELTQAEIQEMVANLEEVRQSKKYGERPTVKQNTRDINTTYDAIDEAIIAAKARNGAETFYLMAKGSVSHYYAPRMRMSEGVEGFWEHVFNINPNEIAQKLEAYLVAGGSAMLKKSGSRDVAVKQLWLDIKAELQKALATKFPTQGMDFNITYKNFERDFGEKYGIKCEGWPLASPAKMCNPSEIRLLADINLVSDRLRDGSMKFVYMSQPERDRLIKERQDARLEKRPRDIADENDEGAVADQEPPKKKRKQRNDAGKKRGPRRKN